jgi:predicted nuclease of predicted toxin-antitoxin system
MRFVVDAQLPPALARFLKDQGHTAEHVLYLGLNEAEDSAIWDYALRHDAVVITKDEDFSIRIAMQKKGPVEPSPAIVWLRVGNTSNRALLDWFAPLLPDIERALLAGERLIEVD